MAIYMIGYDLHPSKGENYDKLFTALEAIGSGYWDCLDSTWLVISEKTPVQIKDELKQYLKDDDRLLVMRYGEAAAWLTFRTEQMAQRQACQQTRFPVAARFAFDRNSDLAPAILCNAAVNLLHEFTLTGQQPHFLAGVDTLRDRQAFEKRDDAVNAGALAFPGRRHNFSDVALRLFCMRTATN